MNITIKKQEGEYEFKYSVEKTGLTKGAHKNLSFHKWTCSELLEAEVFFGEYDNSGATKDELKERGERLINNLPQIKALTDISEPIIEEIIEPAVEEEVASADEPPIEEFTETEEPKKESFLDKIKNKLTNN